ncbi:AAA family ATPase [Novosphingobium sp. ERN07]|uniref:ATP-binding protein n=1 Tax=Novosphingobium sp. ERN07 TaxID=2726187 RepID=UPI0014568174|nr:AAA family ATPase [Novosphingobium sp. ERN07]NLR71678.1 AAA family ATPase [Novosphingobium sp. ERN07]
MNRYFLTQIAIEGFRGINNNGDPLTLSFKPECVNSIYANNGVGKTSIFEALQFAIHGEIPRLAALQGAEQGDSYIINHFHPAKTATIDLKLSPDNGSADVTIRVVRDANGNRVVTSPSGHATPEEVLNALREDFVLVDYKTFAGFIDNTALLRGRSFSALIGLSQYSNLRQAIEGANNTATLRNDLGIKVLSANIAAHKASVAETKRKTIEAYTDLTGQTLDQIDDRPMLESTVTKVLTDIGALGAVMAGKTVKDFDHKAAVAALEEGSDSANRLKLQKLQQDREVVRALTFSEEHVGQLDALEAIAKERDEALTKVGHAELLSLLKSAATVIGTPAWPADDSCPICDLPQELPLKVRLDEKIAAYDAVKELDAELAKLCVDCPAVALLSKLESAAALGVPAEEHIAAGLLKAAKAGSVKTAEIRQVKAGLETLTKACDEKVTALESEILELENSLPPSIAAAARAIENAKKFRDEFAAFDSATSKLTSAETSMAKIDRWLTFIGKADKIFAGAETKLSTERLKEIETAYKGLFPLIMRGAPDLKPHLARAAKSENIDLTLSNFHGEENVNARAVLSESYRNAVAASIFLSAAVKHTRSPRFMVLDDITSSFDGGHQFNLMEVLVKELRYGANPDGVQFILLSHDSALEKFFDRLGNTKDWHHQKLQGMPPTGAVQSSTQGADRLRQRATALLNQGSVDLAGPLVRQYLEYKLGYIIARLQIPVPPDYATRPDNRTLSTYFDAITRAVDLYEKAGECVLNAAQKTAVKQTHATSIIANCIAHYETSVGQPFTAHMLLGVLQDIDQYAENFRQIDPANAGQRIYYRRLDKK